MSPLVTTHVVHVAARIAKTWQFRHYRRMQTVFYYLLGLGAFAFVLGGIIAIVALRNAPEGYETDEGFVGLTKGDEVLLKEFAQGRHYAGFQSSMAHGSIDMAA